ncbi:TetR family transcriptional regulator C-terminal domain-containing protein [Nonomuraea sp. NPDC052129]|uniref:TetR family transcriptional regulator C-terminal domain-containing protein n=1 Tax=Nonomuraea sp. NPDC052129 TaxID=3154651 RepID=UPI003447C75A
MSTWERYLRDALEELHARGLVRPGTSIAGAESDLVALIDGLQVQCLLDPTSVRPPPRWASCGQHSRWLRRTCQASGLSAGRGAEFDLGVAR